MQPRYLISYLVIRTNEKATDNDSLYQQTRQKNEQSITIQSIALIQPCHGEV